ncbi:hypothetical protein AB4Y72_14605 [Arthrobacter sp. YAF34]|uniref:hypothetical protein n=1 Tax=Arthrobacter sp. YAF34 TaxID=3233083 RepID=UPI003F9162C4
MISTSERRFRAHSQCRRGSSFELARREDQRKSRTRGRGAPILAIHRGKYDHAGGVDRIHAAPYTVGRTSGTDRQHRLNQMP